MPNIATYRSIDAAAPAGAEALRIATHSTRTDARCIGWLPTSFYEEMHRKGRLHVVARNDEIVGYATWRPHRTYPQAHVVQAWVRPDARMIEHGRALIAAIEAESRLHGCRSTRLWCATDIEAVAFWQRLGFDAEAIRIGRGSIIAPTRHAPPRPHALFTRRHPEWTLPTPCPTADQPSP